MEIPKITEEMWCFHCEHIWETEDYFSCESCPSCKNTPARIFRTSSFSYVYAYLEKHPEKRPK
jgi:Zn finger protein HypA/HybF involved in hydrogenase expression